MTDTTVAAEPATAATGLPALSRARGMPTAVMIWYDDKLFNRTKEIARIMADAIGFTPKHLIGKTQACFLITVNSMDWKLSPFAVAQCTYETPGGKIGYEGKLCHAILENTGKFVGAPRFEYYGQWEKVTGKFVEATSAKGNKYLKAAYTAADEVGLGIRVHWQVKGEATPRVFDITLRQCQPRNSTLWATDPKTQIGYLAIRRFANVAAPGIFMGLSFDREEDEWSNMAVVGTQATASAPEPEPVMAQTTGRAAAVDVQPEQSGADQNDAPATAAQRFTIQDVVDGNASETDDPDVAAETARGQIIEAEKTHGLKGIEGWMESNLPLLDAFREYGHSDEADTLADICKARVAALTGGQPAETADAPSNDADAPSAPAARPNESFWAGETLWINPRSKGDKPRWKDWLATMKDLIAQAGTLSEIDRLQKNNGQELDGLHLASPEWRKELMQEFALRRGALQGDS